MPTLDHILLADVREPLEVANWIASVTRMSVLEGDNGSAYLTRAPDRRSGNIGGEVQRNFLAHPAQDPSELSLVDHFPILIDFVYTGSDRDFQFSEAVNFFVELAMAGARPMALLRQIDLLIAVYSEPSGIFWMPPGTTPDPQHRDLWYPFVQQIKTAGASNSSGIRPDERDLGKG